MLFISHDLRAVQHISDRICVMYLGKIVELAPAATLYSQPLMPYTRALISAVPVIGSGPERRRMVLTGDVPSPVNLPSGCRFRTRCPYAIEECAQTAPVLRQIKPDHWAACIRIGPEEPDIEAAVTKGIRVQQSAAESIP
jgi:oligopeptide/dipeptide ABC transporter ATP-binding protein